MSEIKSPFLNDEEKTNNEYKEKPFEAKESLGDSERSPFGGFVENDNKIKQEVVTNNTESVLGDASLKDSVLKTKTENADTGSIEIKEEGKFLRNVIVVMVLLLILSLLGLILYSSFNKGAELADTAVHEKKNDVRGTDFEMKGGEFKVSSIVIEQ